MELESANYRALLQHCLRKCFRIVEARLSALEATPLAPRAAAPRPAPDRHAGRALLGGRDADAQAAADAAAVAAAAHRQAAAGAFRAHADDDHAIGAELGRLTLEALHGRIGLALGAEAGGAGGFELGDLHRADRCIGVHLHLRRVDRGTRLAQHHPGTAGTTGQEHGERSGDDDMLIHDAAPVDDSDDDDPAPGLNRAGLRRTLAVPT